MKTLTLSFTLVVIVLLTAAKCGSSPVIVQIDPDPLNVCGFSSPIESLKWLNDQYKSFTGGTLKNGIVAYEFEQKTVIEVQNGLFNSTNQHQYYCDGTRLDLDDSKAFADYRKNRKLLTILYGTDIWK